MEAILSANLCSLSVIKTYLFFIPREKHQTLDQYSNVIRSEIITEMARDANFNQL